MRGATRDAPHARLSVSARCHVPREQWPALWDVSVRLMRQLAQRQPAPERWLDLATQHNGSADPLGVWLSALSQMVGVPGYPLAVSYDNSGRVHIDAACPYHDAVSLALRVASTLLNWSLVALQPGRLHMPLQPWLQALASLPELLPPKTVMTMHYGLWLRGTNWHWLGGCETLVGQGVKQRRFQGLLQVPVSPEDAAGPQPLDAPDAWRVPIYTVTGSVGKTTTVRLLSQLLRSSGVRLAIAASDGAWVGDEQVLQGDCIGGVTAGALLQRPDVAAAIFEQGRGGLVKQGVPYAQSDIAVLLNVQAVHLGLDGAETLQDMADLKVVGLRPARLVVLNLDDAQCRRIGGLRAPQSCVWFSVTATVEVVQVRSRTSGGALGVMRDSFGAPQELQIWQAGELMERLTLQGVAPYHGMLGEKTLEELLAAVAAAWFGPLPVSEWNNRLSTLRLDSENHIFRTSVHYLGDVVFVLDKAGEAASLEVLEQSIAEICQRLEVTRRICVLARSPGEHPDRHLESCAWLHRFMDEFICFDRPDSYSGKAALPIYAPGSIPLLLQEEFLRLNQQARCAKPVLVVPDWAAGEEALRLRLVNQSGKTMVLINQPATSASELNQRIVDFVSGRAVPQTQGQPNT